MDSDFNKIVDQPGQSVKETLKNALLHASHKAYERSKPTDSDYIDWLTHYLVEGIYAQGWYLKQLGAPFPEPITVDNAHHRKEA